MAGRFASYLKSKTFSIPHHDRLFKDFFVMVQIGMIG